MAEKMGALRQQRDDPAYPQITYQRGASGIPTSSCAARASASRPSPRPTSQKEGRSVMEIVEEYPLTQGRFKEALSFYEAHQAEIDRALEAERLLEAERMRKPEHA